MKMIDQTPSELSIGKQCELLEIARSCWYYEPIGESSENLSLMRRIDEIHLEHPYYGVLRMQAELSTAAKPLNKKRIRRLMRKMGIEALYPKPNTSKPCKWIEQYPYLLRDLVIDKPNQVWSMDITYLPLAKGFMYLCAIIDWHSRYLLYWTLSNTLSVDFCLEALQEALDNNASPEIKFVFKFITYLFVKYYYLLAWNFPSQIIPFIETAYILSINWIIIFVVKSNFCFNYLVCSSFPSVA